LTYTFKCENEKCEKFEVEFERNISYTELDNQVCEKCGLPLKRIWNTKVGIRTSDGWKS
jgi:hypothetical protein